MGIFHKSEKHLYFPEKHLTFCRIHGKVASILKKALTKTARQARSSESWREVQANGRLSNGASLPSRKTQRQRPVGFPVCPR